MSEERGRGVGWWEPKEARRGQERRVKRDRRGNQRRGEEGRKGGMERQGK
jgi:hypothetical protein